MSITKCRAKDPSKCRYHGKPEVTNESVSAFNKYKADLQNQAEEKTIKTLEDHLVPVVREISGYEGAVNIIAKSDMTISQKEGSSVPQINNDVKVSLDFGGSTYNTMENVKRTIFAELFNKAIETIKF